MPLCTRTADDNDFRSEREMTKYEDLIREMQDVTDLKIPCKYYSHNLRNKSLSIIDCVLLKSHYQKKARS